MPLIAQRLSTQPIISPEMDPCIGSNINGPSLIKVPTWVKSPLARYYLYFADHKGSFIRLAHAPSIGEPWIIHRPGCLDIFDSLFCSQRPKNAGPVPDWAKDGRDWLYPHIASPDVHVDQDKRCIRMYFHGLCCDGEQKTRVALSNDGLEFDVHREILGPSYFRVFRHNSWWYALAYPNIILRSEDGLREFEPGPALLDPATRHTAALVRGDILHVFWTRTGDAPERIYHAMINLELHWKDWRLSQAREILRPEYPWEGCNLPEMPSTSGAAVGPVNGLRDPGIIEDGSRIFLVYSGSGESAIGIAELSGPGL